MTGKFASAICIVAVLVMAQVCSAATNAELEQRITELEKRLGEVESEKVSLGFGDVEVGGRVMNDWMWISEDDNVRSAIGDQEDGIEFRRIWLFVEGDVAENVGYKVQLNFAGGGTDLQDVYLKLDGLPLGTWKIGHVKEPFSLVEFTSSKYITFMERSLPDIFAPAWNTGIMVSNTALEDSMTWAASLTRETDSNGELIDDGGYNATGRITFNPGYENDGAEVVHLGAAYSRKNPPDSNGATAGDDFRFRARPEAHQTDRFVNTGFFGADSIDLIGLEAAWVAGPFSLQGEYVMANVEGNSGQPDPEFDGWYAQASYWLTGEHRNYKRSSGNFGRVRPHNNFGENGGMGAWEVAARISNVDLNDSGITGGELDDCTLGLNWHLNPHTRIMWNYVRADAEDVGGTAGTDGDADIFMMRFQIDF